jgi:hypothetical protein
MRGNVRWSVRRAASAITPLDLSKINFAAERLTWVGTNEDVVAGTDSTGRIQAVVDRDEGDISAAWTAYGIAVADAYVFSLEFPSSSTNRLVIDVPAGWTLSAPGSLLSSTSDNPAQSGTMTLELGQRDRVQFVARKTSGEQPLPEPLVRQYVTYSVRPESLRFDVVFELDPIGPASNAPEIVLDSGSRVLSVRVGDDVSTAWRVESAGPSQRLIPSLRPGEPARRIVLSCLAAQPIAGLVTLPRASLSRSQTIDIRTVLRLHPSVDIRDLRLIGYRVVDQSRDDTDGGVQVLALRAIQAEPQIELTSTEPTNRLRCRSLVFVEPRETTAEMSAVVEWSAVHGRSFESTLALPPGWEVVNVESLKGSGPSQLAAFEVTTTDAGRQVRLQFRNAVSTERPQWILLSARMPLLAPWPRNVEVGVTAAATEQADSECSVIVGGPSNATAIAASGAFVPTDLAAIQSAFENAAPWRTLMDRAPPTPLAATTRPNKWTAGWLKLSPTSGSENIVQVRCRREANHTHEEFVVKVAAASSETGRIQVFVPGDPTPWEWSDLIGPIEQERIRACSAAEQRAGGWPEDGSLWEISTVGSGPIQLTARRSRSNSEKSALPTATPGAVGDFRGTLQLESTVGSAVIELLNSEGTPLMAGITQSGVSQYGIGATDATVLSWRTEYSASTDRFRIRATNRLKRIAAVQQRTTVRIPDSHESSTDVLHEFDFPADNAPLEVTGSLPGDVQWLKADVDGRAIQVDQAGDFKWSVQLPTVPKPQTLRLSLRATTGAWSHVGNVSIPALTLDTPSVSTRVRILFPKDVQPLWCQSGRLVPVRIRTWTERWFGWLGRADADSQSDSFLKMANSSDAALKSDPAPRSDPGLKSDAALASDPALTSPAGLHRFDLFPTEAMESTSILVCQRGLFQSAGALATLVGAAGACLVRIRTSRKSRLAFVAAISFAAAIALLPEPVSALVASLCCGVAIGWLLPPRWTTSDEPIDESEPNADDLTRTYAAPLPMVRTILLGVLAIASTARAQTPATMDSTATTILDPRFPDPKGQLSEVVYGSAALAEWVEQELARRSRIPDVLITKAAYQLRPPAVGSASMSIRMRLDVQSAVDGSGVLEIPLRGAHLFGDASCRVNEKTVSAELSPLGDRLLIPLEGAGDSTTVDEGGASEADVASEGTTSGWRKHAVTIEWITPQAGGESAFLDFEIPRTLATTVTGAAELWESGFQLAPPFDRVRPSTPETHAVLMPTRSLMGAATLDSRRGSPVQGADSWSLELGVDSAILRRSIRITEPSDSSRRLIWRIPTDWQPVRVDGAMDCIFESLPLPSTGDSLLLVECARPLRAGDLLEVVLRRKQRLSGPEVILAADLFRANESYSAASTWLAVRTGTEFRSEVIAGDSVRIRTLAEFAQRTRESSPAPGNVVELLRNDDIRIRRFLPSATLNVSNAKLTLNAGASRTVAVYSATIEPSAAAVFPWQFELPPGVEVNRVLGRDADVETAIDWRRNEGSIVVFPWERLLRPLQISLEMELETPVLSPGVLPICRLRESTAGELSIEVSSNSGAEIEVTETQPEWSVLVPRADTSAWTMTLPAGARGPKWKWREQESAMTDSRTAEKPPAVQTRQNPFVPIITTIEAERQPTGWQLRGRWWWTGESTGPLTMAWKQPVRLVSVTVDGRFAESPPGEVTEWTPAVVSGIGIHCIELVWRAPRSESTARIFVEDEFPGRFNDASMETWIPACQLFPALPRIAIDRSPAGPDDWLTFETHGGFKPDLIAAQRLEEAQLVSESVSDLSIPWIAATVHRLRRDSHLVFPGSPTAASASSRNSPGLAVAKSEPIVRITGWPARIASTGLATFVVFSLVLIGRRIRDSMDQSRFVAWGILGMWWWWCLSPPIVGLALMIWSLSAAILGLFRGRRTAQTELASST